MLSFAKRSEAGCATEPPTKKERSKRHFSCFSPFLAKKRQVGFLARFDAWDAEEAAEDTCRRSGVSSLIWDPRNTSCNIQEKLERYGKLELKVVALLQASNRCSDEVMR